MKPTICLNMIVKNEAHVIERCLTSVRDHIDYWVIVDTGSSDNTPELIEKLLEDVPGELHHREWKDFATNRTQALDIATGKSDYLLIIDADEEVILPADFRWPASPIDAYELLHSQGDANGMTHWRPGLIRNDGKWCFKGVLHEYLEHETRPSQVRLVGPRIHGHFDGGRSQTSVEEKYSRDAAVLEKALESEPDNHRYVFYLAQSYRDSGQLFRAIEWYERRASMGGWDEEVWVSLFEAARLSDAVGRDEPSVVNLYLRAHDFRPTRAESLANLARYLRERDRFASAKIFAEAALKIPRPRDVLFLDESVYSWRCLDELSIADYWLGNYRECASACEDLLASGAVPEEHKPRIIANRNFALEKLGS